MPVVRFEVGNEYGLADPQLYEAADKDDPEALLEGVAMAGLVGVLRQLGDLAEFAAGIFHNLHEDVMATYSRGHSLMLRVQQLEAEFPPMERTFLSEIDHTQSVHNTGTEWHPNIQIEQNLITGGDMPRFILDSYEECHALPRLFMLDKFDLAGAGACLKRYSDPSFFKIDMAPSGIMEPEVQRERKARKTKKKIPRLRNGESLESPPDPNIAILNHMHSETNARTKRVKLKTRPLNNMESTKKSYMECVLERYIVKDDVLRENGITYSSARTKSIDPMTSHMEPHATAVDNSLENSLLSKTVHESPAIQGIHEGTNKEPSQGTAKLFTVDEVEMLPQGAKPSEKTEGNSDESAIYVEEPVKCVSNKSNGKISANVSENRIDSGSDIYVSDDVASVVENTASDNESFMDALWTMDPEMESDGDKKPKRQFHLSNVESEILNRTKQKTLSKQNLSSDLSGNENVINIDKKESSCLQKSNSPGDSSGSCSFKKEEVPNLLHEVSEVCSTVASKGALDASTDMQSFQLDVSHLQAHENSMISPQEGSSDGEKSLILEQKAGFNEEKVSIPEQEAYSDCEKALISEQEASSSGEERALISEKNASFDEERALISKQNTCSGGENVLIFEQEASSAGEQVLISEVEACSGGEKVLISEEEACSVGEKALISEQDSCSVVEKASISRQEDEMKIGASESESKNAIGSNKFLELSCYLEETKGASSSSAICSSSSPGSSQESGGDQAAITATKTSSINSINKLSEQSFLTPAESSSRTDILCSASNNELFSDIANDADIAAKQPNDDLDCSRDNFYLPRSLEESTVHDSLNIDVSQACHTQLVGAENLTPITSPKDTQEEHFLDHVEGTSPVERVCTSGDFHASPSGKDLQSSAVREIEQCQLERNKSDGHPGGTETAVADNEDLECFRSKSVGISTSPSAENIQSSSSKEDEVLSHDTILSKCSVSFSTKDTPSRSQDLFSDASNDEGEFLILDKDQLHVFSNQQMSESPSRTLPKEEHPTTISFTSKSADPKDSIDEQHYSPVDTISQSSKDSTLLHAAPQKYGSETDESLDLLQEPKDMESVGVLTLSRDNTVQEKMLTSCSESLVSNNDRLLKQIDNNYPSCVSADANKVDELQCNREHDSVEELLSRKDAISPHLHEEHDDVYPNEPHEATENCFPGTEGVVVAADQKKPNLQSLIAVGDPADLNRTDSQDSLDKGHLKMADSQTDVACSVITDSLGSYCMDTPNSSSLDNRHKQVRDIDPIEEMDCGTMLFDIDATLSSESPFLETIGDDVSSSATLPTQLHSDSTSCEASILCARELSLESDSPTEMIIVSESATADASHDLLHPQPSPSVLQNSVSDDSNEVLENNAAHSSKTGCIISLGESSTNPSESSCEPSATLLRRDSGQPPSMSVTQAHSDEASDVVQPDFALSTKTMETSLQASLAPLPSLDFPIANSLQASLAPLPSLDFPIASPVHIDTSESSGKAPQSFPFVGPSTLQCDIDATSLLPPLPLPPLQWRMGKTKVSPQASTATVSDPLSSSNIFAPLSGEGYLQSHLESSAMNKQCFDAESQYFHCGSMSTGEGSSSPSDRHTATMQHSGGESYNPTSVNYCKEDAQTKFTFQDAYDAKIENPPRYPKAFEEEATSYQKSFAPAVAYPEINLHSSALGDKQMHAYRQLESLQIPSTEKHQSSIATPQSAWTDLQCSGPFMGAPPTIDPRYQYNYRLFGGESMQPFATQGIIPRHGFYMPVGENIYGPYSMPLPQRDSEKPNGRPNSILNRPRDPLIEAVASHDKRTLRKVSEIVQTSPKPKEDERNILLDQIKEKTFNLKPTAVMRPNVKGPATNLKVAAILEKANAMRQACAGSDDEDSWSDC